ncbi:hypothetical protein RvY_04734 [Ramazzottius varieornatus]|uniref:Uncharacterized protein n=1 Tax=Ramazzottius varieornatus TaxID=947166 RepID=A0A1D1UW36_RAMVA|nr:hypothetical protein RvY_04734 [Ramazzottius varieornatus]
MLKDDHGRQASLGVQEEGTASPRTFPVFGDLHWKIDNGQTQIDDCNGQNMDGEGSDQVTAEEKDYEDQ